MRLAIPLRAAPPVSLMLALVYAATVWPLYIWDVRVGGVILWLVAMVAIPTVAAVVLSNAVGLVYPGQEYGAYGLMALHLVGVWIVFQGAVFPPPEWSNGAPLPFYEGSHRRKVIWLIVMTGPTAILAVFAGQASVSQSAQADK
jgi:hypothetical protein